MILALVVAFCSTAYCHRRIDLFEREVLPVVIRQTMHKGVDVGYFGATNRLEADVLHRMVDDACNKVINP